MTLTNKDVREALKGSIEKWYKISTGVGEDHGTDNCPLCQMFVFRFGSCLGCPVQIESGYAGCNCTPYKTWSAECSDDSWETNKAVTAKDKRLAKAMMNYLIGLDKKFFGN